MKWIAVRRTQGDGGLIDIIPVERVHRFVALKENGNGVVAYLNDGTSCGFMPADAGSDTAKLLEILNGPVGEVPWK